MNPMQKTSTTKATSKPPRRSKSKKKRAQGVVGTQVAETPSDFSFAIAKIAVAQICQVVGFKRAKLDALEILTNVAAAYLQAIARSAASFANASNRFESNLFDLVNAIHDLYSLQGFPSGSEMHKINLLRSGALKEIEKFVNLSKEVPFAKPIPCKTVSGSPNPEPTICLGVSMSCFKKPDQQGLQIPRWLPDFPEENLYKNGDQILVKERKCGEKLWEHSHAMNNYSGNEEVNRSMLQSNEINGNEEEDKRMELAKGRGRVQFKIGGKDEKQRGWDVNTMNGICKGRKRVSWNHSKINDCIVEENADESSAFKKER